ncbi:MAG: Maf family protein, partial [Anaerolineae bacterium]|nr:Maf family protein [Anaerolineae bacterium]
MHFILASSSPRRRELLGSLGIPFTIRKPDIDETQHPGEPPLDYVARLSREKAAAVATANNAVGTRHAVSDESGANLILAADTVVILGADTLGVDEHGDILGKPTDADDVRDMLQRLRGRVHQVCTALTLLYPTPRIHGERRHDNPVFAFEPSLEFALKMRSMGRGTITRLTTTHVTMRDYTDAEIDAYIATGDPFDKAGSYAIQHPVFKPVARIDGCYTNVVGLPVCTLKNMLAEIGWPGMQPVESCD